MVGRVRTIVIASRLFVRLSVRSSVTLGILITG